MSATPNATMVQPKSASSLLSCLAVWCLTLLLAVLAVTALRPPKPVSATAPESEFSAERALVHVRVIARSPHPIGSDANRAVREYLVTQMAAIGLNPQVVPMIGARQGGRSVVFGNTNDIVGRLPGTAKSPAILLMAHYDSVDRGPGAADDGAAVAAILESVRALRTGPALKNDLIVLFTDGEEAGLLGADAFTASHPWMKDVALLLNFEARGNQGPSLLFETSAGNAPLIKAVGEAAPYPVGSSLFYAFYKLLPNDTDFTIVRSSGTPGLNFAFGEGLEAYHSRLDTAENLSASSLQHHGSYVLSLTRHFGQTDLAQFKNSGGDDVFFDWFGSHFIVYGEKWVLPGEILATVLLILAIFLDIRNSEIRISRIVLALLPCLALLLAIPAVLAGAGWLFLRLLAGRMIVSDSPANSWILIGLILLGAGVGSLLFSGFRKRFSVQELWLSGLIVVCILSWALALMLPAGSYLLFWPLLLVNAGLVVAALTKKMAQPGTQFLSGLAGAVISILLFAPIAYLLYVFLTLQLITFVAAGLLLGLFFLLCTALVNVAVPRNWTRYIVLVLLAGAFISLGVGARLSHYSPEHPRRDSVLYSLNADDHTAAWISFDRALDNWTSQFFPDKPVQPQPAPNYLLGSQRPVFSSPAPLMDWAVPIAEIKADEKQGDVHNIRINVRSPRNARTLVLALGKDVQPAWVKLGERKIITRQSSSPFSVVLLGIDAKGADLELSLKAPSGVSFWLSDQSDGLPTAVRPRPNDLVAGGGSDVTIISRKYSF